MQWDNKQMGWLGLGWRAWRDLHEMARKSNNGARQGLFLSLSLSLSLPFCALHNAQCRLIHAPGLACLVPFPSRRADMKETDFENRTVRL